jgi:fructose-1,6-bisphosphatase II / sedoheptulose-1,7-bisphosphatase
MEVCCTIACSCAHTQQTNSFPVETQAMNIEDGTLQRLQYDLAAVTHAAVSAAKPHVGTGDVRALDYDSEIAAKYALRGIMARVRLISTEGGKHGPGYSQLHYNDQFGRSGPHVDVALDTIENTSAAATGRPNAISICAASIRGHGLLLHTPDCLMQKWITSARGARAVEAAPDTGGFVEALSYELKMCPSELNIAVLDRPRNASDIAAIKKAGAHVQLIDSGDLSVAIECMLGSAPIDAVVGSGGMPEGVLTAAVARCLGANMRGVFAFRNDDERAQASMMHPCRDMSTLMSLDELAIGDITVAITALTNTSYLAGAAMTSDGLVTDTVVFTRTDRMRIQRCGPPRFKSDTADCIA